MSDKIQISKFFLLVEFADILENHPSIKKITNEDGYMIVPTDRYPDFGYDLGIIIGRILEKLSEPYDEESDN